MYKHDFKARLSDINKTINAMVEDAIIKFKLNADDVDITTYRIILENGKCFHGFYIGHKLYAGLGKKVDVWFSFYKVKKCGQRSKVKTGCFLSSVKTIESLPF